MPLHTCANCGAPKTWNWEDAFLSYGFDNGANSKTTTVVSTLEANGYTTALATYADNEFIENITKDGVEQISQHDWIGETDPRDFLPADIIALLDHKHPHPAPYGVYRVPTRFTIDQDRSTNDTLHVVVSSHCTVAITQSSEGVEVQLVPSYPSAHPICAAYFPLDDIKPPQREKAS